MNGSVVGSIPDFLSGGVTGYVNANGGSGSTVVVSPEIIEDGTLICTITVDGTKYYLYAPTPTSVSVAQVLQEGTKIGSITVGNQTVDLYAPTPTSVSVSQIVSSGTKIGTITVGNQTVDLYAPTPIRTASGISYDNTSSEMTADNVQEAVDELKSNLDELATVDKASSPTVVAVDGTYQIPNNVLAHKIIIIGVRRQGNGGSVCFEKSNLLAMDSHFAIMATHSGSGYTLKCSTTGVLTLVGKDSGLLEPFIEVVGLF